MSGVSCCCFENGLGWAEEEHKMTSKATSVACLRDGPVQSVAKNYEVRTLGIMWGRTTGFTDITDLLTFLMCKQKQ